LAVSPGSLWRRFRRWRRRLGFAVLSAISAIAGRFGPAAEGRVGAGLGQLHYFVALRQRQRLAAWLAEVFPEQSPARIRAQLRQSFRISDRSVLEIIGFFRKVRSAQEIAARCQVDGLANLEAAVAAGRGVLLVGMHAGNGVLMCLHLAQLGLPLAIVYRESRKVPPGFFDAVFQRHGMQTICVQRKARPDDGPVDEETFRLRLRARAYRDMLRALQKGHVVLVLMDQGMRHGGVPVPFLGRTVEMPAGPAELAQRTGAAIVPFAALAARPRWHFAIAEPLAQAEDPESTTRAIAAVLESQIRAQPALWSWHHRRWARAPATY